jgi:hypothetical protein
METTPTVFYSKSKDDSFFKKRYNTTAAFAVGLLMFLLPFAELRCGDMALMSNSGIGLAVGSEWKVRMGGNKLFDKMNSDVKDEKAKKTLSGGINIFAIVALVGAILGLCFSLTDTKWKDTAVMCAGILACLMLIALMIQLKIQMRSAMSGAKEEKFEESMSQLVKIKFTMWYYISLVAFACAAFFSYKRQKIEMEEAVSRLAQFEFQQQQQQSPGSQP